MQNTSFLTSSEIIHRILWLIDCLVKYVLTHRYPQTAIHKQKN